MQDVPGDLPALTGLAAVLLNQGELNDAHALAGLAGVLHDLGDEAGAAQALRVDAAIDQHTPPPTILPSTAGLQRMRNAGTDSILPKPFELAELEQLLVRFLGSPPQDKLSRGRGAAPGAGDQSQRAESASGLHSQTPSAAGGSAGPAGARTYWLH